MKYAEQWLAQNHHSKMFTWVGQRVLLGFFPINGSSSAHLSLTSFETIFLRLYCDSCHLSMHLKKYLSKLLNFYVAILILKMEENKQHFWHTMLYYFKKGKNTSWLVWLSGLSAGLWTKGLMVQFPSGHMPGFRARFPVRGAWEATTHWCFSPSLSVSLPLSLKMNKSLKKKKKDKNSTETHTHTHKELCSVWRRCRDWSNASKVVWEVSCWGLLAEWCSIVG